MQSERHQWRGWLAILFLIGLLSSLALALAGCGQAGGPSLPNGWSWYRDSEFPFEMPVPPGWRTDAYWAEYFRGDRCARVVALVPPVSQASPQEIESPSQRVPELIQIKVMDTCPDFTPMDNRGLTSASQAITISGAPGTLYHGDPDIAVINRLAVTRFGGHQYLLNFWYEYTDTTPSKSGQENLALYQQVLHGFKYIGK